MTVISKIKEEKTGQFKSTEAVCRFCGNQLKHEFVDLGMSPLCENYLTIDQINKMEPFYPLKVYVCDKCFLVQLEEYVGREEIFSEYAYFSSYSDSWLRHSEKYTDMMVKRFRYGNDSFVVELASNDGYLLQYFVDKGIPVLGIEPAKNVAETAIDKGVPTLVEFFGVECAYDMVENGRKADLIIGNNVLAQVPDVNDFVGGIKILLAEDGVVTIEFPHLKCLIEGNQLDTIYHEHFSYFSLLSAEAIFSSHGMEVFDVERLRSHGGSLRLFVKHTEDKSKKISERVKDLRQEETEAGFKDIEFYKEFGEHAKKTKRQLLEFLIKAKKKGKKVAGYGAPGKGNTLLNYCGIRTDFIDFTVDRNPYKHGKFLPGSHIPIFDVDMIQEAKPDYVFILPWNLKDEIMNQMSFIRDWGGKFAVPIPEVTIY